MKLTHIYIFKQAEIYLYLSIYLGQDPENIFKFAEYVKRDIKTFYNERYKKQPILLDVR